MRVPNDRRHILFRLAMLLLRILSGRPSRGCELLTSRVANFQRCSLVDGQVQFNAFYIGPLRRVGGRSLKPIDVALHNLLSVVWLHWNRRTPKGRPASGSSNQLVNSTEDGLKNVPLTLDLASLSLQAPIFISQHASSVCAYRWCNLNTYHFLESPFVVTPNLPPPPPLRRCNDQATARLKVVHAVSQQLFLYNSQVVNCIWFPFHGSFPPSRGIIFPSRPISSMSKWIVYDRLDIQQIMESCAVQELYHRRYTISTALPA